MRRNLLFIVLGMAACLLMGIGSVWAQDLEEQGAGYYGGPTVTPGGIGDLGFASLFDVRPLENRTDAWQNYLVVENTTGNWVAFHLRFRAWRKSIEIYDHIILLSPYDVFWCIIELAKTAGTSSAGESYIPGDVLISSADTETLLNSGLIFPGDLVDGNGYWLALMQYFLLQDCGYGNPAVAEERLLLQEEVQAGHIEVLGLWQLEVPSSYNGEDTHDLTNVVRDLWLDSTDTINVYDVLEALFYERGDPAHKGQYQWPGWACDLVRISGLGTPTVDDDNETGLDGKARWGMDCGNVLTGSLEMYDTGNGQYGLENLIFVEDFRTGGYGDYLRDWPKHRDGYPGGAIVYPTSIMEWNVNYYPYHGYLHPAWYVNKNWATTVGPGLRDGDDWNWWDNPPVPDFNGTWSLDDLEYALEKYEIWYQWFALTTYDGAVVTTSVNLTYPTKLYHYFWRDWPYYNGQLNTANAPCYGPSQLPKVAPANWGAYYVKCAGSAVATDPNSLPTAGAQETNFYPSNVFGSAQAYVAAVDAYRGTDAEPRIDSTGASNPCADAAHGSIKTWFDAHYSNGPIYTEATMWDMDEHRESTTPGTPPPGSPWRPTFRHPKSVPHEVNIIIVGGGERTGIEEATGLLDEAPVDWGYKSGHFRIDLQELSNGTHIVSIPVGYPVCTGVDGNLACTSFYLYEEAKVYGDLWYEYLTADGYYPIPAIGWIWFTHTYGEGVDGITRSALAEWHYKSGLSYSSSRVD